jgi:hypothetical protein
MQIGLCKYSTILKIVMESPHKTPIVAFCDIFSTFDIHLRLHLDVDWIKNHDSTLECNIVGLFINIKLEFFNLIFKIII